MANETNLQKESIVLYPAPGIGHVISMVELGKLILNRYSNRFSITILLTTGCLDTPAMAPYIRHVSQSNPSISFRRFPPIRVDPLPPRSGAAKTFEFIRLNIPNVSNELQDLSKMTKVRAFIIDLFCTSALRIGKEMEIPTYYFFTSGAAVLGAFLYFPEVHERASQTTSFKDLFDVVLEYPGIMPPLNAYHMPEPMLDRDDPSYWDLVYFCSHLAKSSGIIVNTFDGLEPIPVKGLADGVCGKIPQVYYIGPLIAKEKEKLKTTMKEEDEDCLSWLDQQPSRSVVFLCFGSRGTFTKQQIREIANGVEKSGHRFLWVVKEPSNDDRKKQISEESTDFVWDNNGGLFPEGFLERTSERGMVVKSWAPQIEVLNKEAVGGFVTHCGWNSVLEAVVAGVPMVAWPLYAEQHMNRNVLVKDMRVAIDVEQRKEDGFVSADEVERRIRELMESEHGTEIREHVMKMKEFASAAWGKHGTSAIALEKFVHQSIG